MLPTAVVLNKCLVVAVLMTLKISSTIFSHPPGVDVHAEHGLADEAELDKEAEDQAAEAKVQEPLEERRARQHSLHEKRNAAGRKKKMRLTSSP